MKRGRLARFTAAAAILALAIPATASAPVGQYDTFNQFNTTITDRKTGLEWQRGLSTSTLSWDDANSYCRGLLLGGLPAGSWRLPSVKELLTLVDEKGEAEYVTGLGLQYYAIDRGAFPDTPNGLFWAWPKDSMSGNAWNVDFRTGEARTTNPSTSYYVRCVH